LAGPKPNWDAFDPETYLEHNYRQVLGADQWLFLRLIEDVRNAAGDLAAAGRMRSADIGTGPNLYPLLATAPYVAVSDALEIGALNRRYLLRQLAELDPIWKQWIALAGEHGEVIDETRFRTSLRVGATSILDLPVEAYDIVTSFFCAESITEDRAVFDAACKGLVAATRPHGLLAAAFMLGSTGYDTAGRQFPAVPVETRHLAEFFTPLLNDLRIETVPNGSDLRAGYTGMAYLSGRRPVDARI
jgi:hypothetical protein